MPSLELMEAAGRALAEAAAERGAATGPAGSSAARATTAATAWSPPASSPRPGTRSRRCCSGRPRRALAPTRAPTSSASTAPRRGRRRRARRRRWPGSGVVVDAIFGTGFCGRAARPGGRGDRGDQRAAAPRSSPPTSPPGVDASTGEVEGAAVEADVTVSFHAAKLGHWIAPGKAHTGELGWRRSASRRRSGRARRRADRRRGARPRAAPRRPTRPSSTPARSSSSAARAG